MYLLLGDLQNKTEWQQERNGPVLAAHMTLRTYILQKLYPSFPLSSISTVFTVVIAVYTAGSLVRVSIHTVWLMASYTSICAVYRVTFVIDCFLHRPSCRDMNSGVGGAGMAPEPCFKTCAFHVFVSYVRGKSSASAACK